MIGIIGWRPFRGARMKRANLMCKCASKLCECRKVERCIVSLIALSELATTPGIRNDAKGSSSRGSVSDEAIQNLSRGETLDCFACNDDG
jgi:hypothetical protein